MRFETILLFAFLTGSATAVPAFESFASNRVEILSGVVFDAGEYVFATGRAKSPSKAGDDIGYSKAEVLAYDNLDRINFERSEWPDDATPEERAAAWLSYRAKHRFSVEAEGVQRVFSGKSGNEMFLSVLAFPKDSIALRPAPAEDLKLEIEKARAERRTREISPNDTRPGPEDDVRGTATNTPPPHLEFDPLRGVEITPLDVDANRSVEPVEASEDELLY